MISSQCIRHKELRKLFDGKSAEIDARWKRNLERILAQLNVAVSPMELQHYRCHALTGDRKGYWALHVSPNWRLTFQWDEDGPFDINLEDYHGQ